MIAVYAAHAEIHTTLAQHRAKVTTVCQSYHSVSYDEMKLSLFDSSRAKTSQSKVVDDTVQTS